MTPEEIEARFELHARELAVQADLLRELMAVYKEAVQVQKRHSRLIRRAIRELKRQNGDDENWWKRGGD